MVNIHTHTLRKGELTPIAAGIHPWSAEIWRSELPLLPEGCEAIGEIGLDYACSVDTTLQERLFRAQLNLAEELKLPVVLHCVRAFEPTMKLLKEFQLHGVIFHGFIGSWQQAEQALKQGYFLSFGERSFRSPRTVEVIKKMPLERFFLETDESPVSIAEIYHLAANILKIEVAYLQKVTMENFNKLFR